jgi:predicted nucleic acid-binding protein
MNVLIDSSAWIAFLREGRVRHPDVAAALEAGTAMLCPVVWLELWAGVRGKREEAVLMNIRETCGWLEINASVWEQATAMGRVAQQRGLTCPLADLLIVACAKRHGAELLHRDKHIDQLLALAVAPPNKGRTK